MKRRVVVVGGGAAGLMAALFAARAGVSPLLLEGSRSCGIKILVSGGGRCNVLPSRVDDSDFFTTGSRNVLRRIFRTWELAAVKRFFAEELAIPLRFEPETGKLFPADQKARTVRDALVRAVEQAGGEVRTEARVDAIDRCRRGFSVKVAPKGQADESVEAQRLVLATGGQSMPRSGSDGAGYAMVRALGHQVLTPYPALVPLLSDAADMRSLSGMSVPVRWRAVARGKTREERVRELLFTHHGFSGPAVLDASHWSVREGATIEVAWRDLSETLWREELGAANRKTVVNALGEHLPRRLARILCARAGIDDATKGAHLSKEKRQLLIDRLVRFSLPVDGNRGFRIAEVTGGGVPLGEVDPSTLESRRAAGLFLCGEIFDVIGRIGGYNFLWAWVTGRRAGQAAADSRRGR